MRVVYRCCCGLDVHKRTVTACVITPEGRETRTFKTMTADLGPNYHDERTHHRTLRRAVQRIERLGYKVTLEVAA